MTFRLACASLALVCTTVIAPASAQSTPSGVKGVLDNASDAALDKLSKPGAFSADDAIRIALPGAKGLGDMMKLTDRAGLTNDITGKLNRAAEQAASEAKPIFRAAIDRMSLKDAVDIGDRRQHRRDRLPAPDVGRRDRGEADSRSCRRRWRDPACYSKPRNSRSSA